MSIINKVKGRQVFDSRGNPTVEAEVILQDGSSGRAIVPSGASTGTYEAFEKRDNNNKKYLGKSVLNAVKLVNTKVSKKLKGLSIHNQEKIDAIMINLDGTKQKTKLGARMTLPGVQTAAETVENCGFFWGVRDSGFYVMEIGMAESANFFSRLLTKIFFAFLK